MDEVFKALADSSRRKLLDELHKNNGQTLSGEGARNCITSIQCRCTRSPSAGLANTNAIAFKP
jgi:hypothetical protein